MTIAPSNIKVCAFSYYFPPHFSGAGLQTLTLAKELSKQGIQYFFVTVDNTGLARHDRYEGFDVYRISEGPKKHGEFLLWWNLFRILRKLRHKFDIIHASGSTYRNSAVGVIGRALGKKSLTLVSIAHNDLYDIGRTRVGIAHKYLLGYVDRYVSLSSQITDELKVLPLDNKKAVEIPQGVNTERFRIADAQEQAALRCELNLPERPIALYTGVFDSRKNVEWLVHTWIKHTDKFSDWCLLLVGPTSRDKRDADLRERLIAVVRGAGLEREILFRDFSPVPEKYYRCADLFILPSRNEGLPNVVLEAMSCGLPSVVSRVSGAIDIIEHGISGMLFNVDDERTFVDAVKPLMADRQRRTGMGRRASAAIHERLSSKKSAERYLQLYRSMLSDR
jgi:glycosyltransferase involved in cell wall biosynthesis